MVHINLVDGLKVPINIVGVFGLAVVSVAAKVKRCRDMGLERSHDEGLERSYKGRPYINDMVD